MKRALLAVPLLAAAASMPACMCTAKGTGVATVGGGIDGCKIASQSTAPLIVEWTAATRGQLEALRAKHVIAVRYTGCELELLPACTVKSSYAYVPLTPKRDVVTVRDEGELYANLPMSAASLSGKLKSAGRLGVAMTVVGRFEAQAAELRADQLEGDCAKATHVIAGLTTGSFSFYAGSSGEVGGGVSVAGIGAGGDSKSSVEVLNRDGDDAACAKAAAGASGPPYGCGALIRLELARIGAVKPAQPACPERFTWDGRQCVSPEPPPGAPPACSAGGAPPCPSPEAPPGPPPACTAGAPLDKGGCPPGPGNCPKGTHHEGAGCAPDAAGVGAMIRIPGASYRWARGDKLVSVATFDLDVTEVTLAQFKACVDAGKCMPSPSQEERCNWGKDLRARHPMNCVTWEEAKGYCAWAGKRLPTELEWEYAETGQTGWRYPWGNDAPDATRRCNVNDGSVITCPVGTFPAGQSRFGILDMSGNVGEWMLDAWCGGFGDSYGEECRGSARTTRSGVPATARELRYLHERSSALGFRCARTVAASPGPRVCPAGTVYALDMCVPESGRCPAGMHVNGKECVPDGSP